MRTDDGDQSSLLALLQIDLYENNFHPWAKRKKQTRTRRSGQSLLSLLLLLLSNPNPFVEAQLISIWSRTIGLNFPPSWILTCPPSDVLNPLTMPSPPSTLFWGSTNPAQMKSLKYLDNSIPSIPLTNRQWTCPWNHSFGAYIGLWCEYCCAGLFPCEISRNPSPQIPERDERTIFGFLRLIWIKINLYPFVLLVVLTSFLASPRCVLRRGKLSWLTHNAV